MVRLSAWVTEEQKRWVEQRGEEHESGQAGVIRDLIDAARRGESLSESETDSVVNQNESGTESQAESLTDVADRLEAVADRLETSTDESLSESVSDSVVNHSTRNPPSSQNGSDSPESDSSSKTMDTPRQERNEAVSAPVDAREDDTALSAEWILENAAWSEHEVTATDGRAEALAEAHAIVATTDDVTSGELAERLVEDDRVGLSEGTVRNHLLPVLGSLPGVVQPGSGQRKWRCEGDYSTNS